MPVSYVDNVYAWRRASASAVVGEARAWLPSYGEWRVDAELATGDNGHQTLAGNGATNWWTEHKTTILYFYFTVLQKS